MFIKNAYRNLVPNFIRKEVYGTRKRLKKDLRNLSIDLTDKNVRLSKKRLNRIKGRHEGHQCFIMGNGPSLNKMDLELFKDEYVWGSNRCYLLFDRISWRPKFYTAVDTRVVPDNANEISALTNALNETIFFFPINFRYKNVLQSNTNIYWYEERYLNEKNLPFSMFSIEADRFVYSVHTVTIAALQLAVYLGFNPIYLIGCDTRYTIPKSVKFEDGKSDLLVSTEEDPNHFSPDYFGPGKKWHDPHVERMIFHYEQAKRVCDEIGVNVYNATLGGNLEVFPRVDYKELFNEAH